MHTEQLFLSSIDLVNICQLQKINGITAVSLQNRSKKKKRELNIMNENNCLKILFYE